MSRPQSTDSGVDVKVAVVAVIVPLEGTVTYGVVAHTIMAAISIDARTMRTAIIIVFLEGSFNAFTSA
jgi:hypothetical protein